MTPAHYIRAFLAVDPDARIAYAHPGESLEQATYRVFGDIGPHQAGYRGADQPHPDILIRYADGVVPRAVVRLSRVSVDLTRREVLHLTGREPDPESSPVPCHWSDQGCTVSPVGTLCAGEPGELRGQRLTLPPDYRQPGGGEECMLVTRRARSGSPELLVRGVR